MNTDAEYHILNLLREIKEILKPTPVLTAKPVPAVKPVPPSSRLSGPAIGKPAVGKPVSTQPSFSGRTAPPPQPRPTPFIESPFHKK